MTATYDFRPSGTLKVLLALMKPVIAGNVKSSSTSFKAICERRAGDRRTVALPPGRSQGG
jgi:hypothetical protein